MDATDHSFEGHCYCGGVGFVVTLPAGEKPVFTAYCHCDSCRRAHAAPLYHVVAVRADAFAVTRGADLLNDFQKDGGRIVRAFCNRCGTRVLNRFSTWRPGGHEIIAWFPNLLGEGVQQPMPAILRPHNTANAGECVLDREFLARFLEGV